MPASLMGHPWRPTAAIFFVNGAVFGVWATQIPLAKDRLGLDPAILGILLLILGAGAVTAMMASGYLIRRFGTAPIMRWSGASFCLFLPITAIAPDVDPPWHRPLPLRGERRLDGRVDERSRGGRGARGEARLYVVLPRNVERRRPRRSRASEAPCCGRFRRPSRR